MIGNKPRIARTLGPGLVLAAVVAALGCAPGEDPAPPTSPSTTAPSTQTPPATPSTEAPAAGAQPVVLPACDAMNATAQRESDEFYALAASGGGVTAHRGEVDLTIFGGSAGPSAQSAMAEAVQVRGCTWPVQYHNVVTQYVAEIPATTRETLIAALRDSLYVESTAGPALRFDHTEFGDPDAPISIDTRITYLFLGEVWIAIVGNGQLDYAEGALEGLYAVNPGLAASA